jgi:hypothetical protein
MVGDAAEGGRVDDVFEQLIYRWDRIAVGAEATLTVPTENAELFLSSVGVDRWSFAGGPEPQAAIEGLTALGAKLDWGTAELLKGRWPEASAGTQVKVVLPKQPWAGPISRQTGRSVWIGPSVAGFADWIARTGTERIAAELFAEPGALVLLADWSGEEVAVGRRLTVGSLVARAPRVEDSEELEKRIEEEEKRRPWRLLDVDLRVGLPAELDVPLARAAGITAAHLIAERSVDGTFYPDAERGTTWKLPVAPGRGPADVEAIVRLARWLGEYLVEDRFAVARSVAARMIDDPLAGGPADPPYEAAVIAYRRTVDEHVVESLERQQRLEESFRQLDDEAAAMRASIDETVDGTVTKALAGALAITIAALTSKEVRDWPATIAALVLAGYLWVNAAMLVQWRRRDADVRLRDAGELASQRIEELGVRLQASCDEWRRQLRTRVSWAVAILLLLGLALAVSGVVANDSIF